jgi:transketolase
MSDYRDTVFGAVHDLMRKDKDAVVLVNDQSALAFEAIKAEYPARAINVGIAEQNMMSVAAGLAHSGRHVFVHGIIAHIVFRALEQIKIDICLHNLPVTILGIGAGLSYAKDGPTHWGLDDVPVLSVLSNLRIWDPPSAEDAAKAVYEAYEHYAPGYIRMYKAGATTTAGTIA